MLEPEEWREIPGLDGWYEASSLGRIRSWKVQGSRFQRRAEEPRVLSPQNQTLCGYIQLDAHVQEKRRRLLVHRAVAAAFGMLDGLDDGLKVDHIDGNKQNNCATNLRACTHQQNLRNRHMKKNEYHGISQQPDGRWQAYYHDSAGRNAYAGRAQCPTKAAIMRDLAIIEELPDCEFYTLNFPALRGRDTERIRALIDAPRPKRRKKRTTQPADPAPQLETAAS